QPLVVNAPRPQGFGQRRRAELGQAAGTRMAPHIGNGPDTVVPQKRHELIERAGGVAHGPDLHGQWIRVRADSLCMATWSVLSLLISYWGESGLARRRWPLYSVSRVWMRMMWPLTWPDSEFPRTWSPTWNLVMAFPFGCRFCGVTGGGWRSWDAGDMDRGEAMGPRFRGDDEVEAGW